MIGIVVAAALVVAAGAVGAWVLTRPPSAEAVADDYLRALSKGDLAGIESVVVDGHSRQLDQVGAAFAGAQGYISHYSVELGDERHGHARRMRTQNSAEEHRRRLHPHTTGRPVAGVGLPRIARGSHHDRRLGAVGGVLTGADQPIPLLPAVYPVAAAPSGLLDGKATAVVTTEAPVVVAIAASVSPDAGERATAAGSLRRRLREAGPRGTPAVRPARPLGGGSGFARIDRVSASTRTPWCSSPQTAGRSMPSAARSSPPPPARPAGADIHLPGAMTGRCAAASSSPATRWCSPSAERRESRQTGHREPQPVGEVEDLRAHGIHHLFREVLILMDGVHAKQPGLSIGFAVELSHQAVVVEDRQRK